MVTHEFKFTWSINSCLVQWGFCHLKMTPPSSPSNQPTNQFNNMGWWFNRSTEFEPSNLRLKIQLRNPTRQVRTTLSTYQKFTRGPPMLRATFVWSQFACPKEKTPSEISRYVSSTASPGGLLGQNVDAKKWMATTLFWPLELRSVHCFIRIEMFTFDVFVAKKHPSPPAELAAFKKKTHRHRHENTQQKEYWHWHWNLHPGRLNGWNLTITCFQKEKNLNQTSMIMCKMLIFQGVTSWYFGMIHGHGEFPKHRNRMKARFGFCVVLVGTITRLAVHTTDVPHKCHR